MPKNPNPHKAVVDQYATEVLQCMGSDISRYKSAFARVAHAHDIFHWREPGQYNYFFGAVQGEVKRRLKNRPKVQVDLVI